MRSLLLLFCGLLLEKLHDQFGFVSSDLKDFVFMKL